MTPAQPLPAAALENPPAGEPEAIADLVAMQRGLIDPAKPRRGQHAKGHGIVRAEFAVRGDLPPEFRVGLFREPRTFAAWVRFSNGFAADDRQPDVHGAAVKLLGVPGVGEHDFLLADHPVFFAADVRKAVDVFSDRVALLRQGLPPDEVGRRLAAEFPTEATLLGHFVSPPPPSPLEAAYWSVTPYAFGGRAVKYHLRPWLMNRTRNTAGDSPDFLRDAMTAVLTTAGWSAVFDFCVQPQGHPAVEPVEDPTVEWLGPDVPVALLTIPPQAFDTPDRAALEAALAFAPAHSLPEHRPLGGINRGRQAAYAMSWDLRKPPGGSP